MPEHEHDWQRDLPKPGLVRRICACGLASLWGIDKQGQYIACQMMIDIDGPPTSTYRRLMTPEEREAYQELMDA